MLVVDADANGRIRIFRRRADQDPFRAALADMQFGLVAAGEKSGRFQDDVDAQDPSTADSPGRAPSRL